MKVILLVIASLVYGVGFCQKNENIQIEKNGTVYFQNQKLFYVDEESFAGEIDFVVKNPDGNVLITISLRDYLDPFESFTDVHYFELSFTGYDDFCETGRIFPTKKGIANFVIKNQLIDLKTGKLNDERIPRFIRRVGKPVSERIKILSKCQVIMLESDGNRILNVR